MSYLEDNLPDNRRLDKFDKIKAYLEDPNNNHLESRLMKSLDHYKMTLAFMLENEDDYGGRRNSPNAAINYLSKKHGFSYPQACKVVRETLQLYGNLFMYDKESLKFYHYERLIRLADEATSADDYKAAAALEKQAIELMELRNPTKIDKKQILKVFQINIHRTTDPKALESSTIDITPDDND